MADARVQRLGGLLGLVLVDEAEPHRGQRDHSDDHRVAALTDEERRAGRDRQQDQQRRAKLPSQHRKRPNAVRAHRVRPEHPQAPRRLRCQARPVAAQPGQHIGDRHRARGHNPQRRSSHQTGRTGTVSNCQMGTSTRRMSPHWHPAASGRVQRHYTACSRRSASSRSSEHNPRREVTPTRPSSSCARSSGILWPDQGTPLSGMQDRTRRRRRAAFGTR
jgi:hypothetical protein